MWRDVSQVLARNMKELRMKKGLTQKNLAERLGVQRSYVSMMENNRAMPSIHTLDCLAQILEVEPWQLLF